jgi:uncharacterized tellurite resistance protein B-like protein
LAKGAPWPYAMAMFERFLSFLKDLPRGKPDHERDEIHDPRIAAAALMFHVIDADGVRDKAERRRLREVISEAYSVKGGELERIIAEGEAAEREAVDLYAFTSVLLRHLGPEARVELIRLLWEMVYADGEAHELEDNVVWRVAELIGVDSRDRILMRQKVRAVKSVNL